MGLDTVELVMEIEDEFEIDVPDEDAEKIQTCGDLHAYVLHRLRPLRGAPCRSAAAFHALRRSILRRLPGVRRRDVRPAARIHHLLGEAHAHRWPDVARDCRLDRAYSFGGRTDIYPPAAYTTLANLARRMAFPDWRESPPPGSGGTADELSRNVWQRITRIVVEQLGVRPQDVRPEAHFINDLNAD